MSNQVSKPQPRKLPVPAKMTPEAAFGLMRRMKIGEIITVELNLAGITRLKTVIDGMVERPTRYRIQTDGTIERLPDFRFHKPDARRGRLGEHDDTIMGLDVGGYADIVVNWERQQAVRRAAKRLGVLHNRAFRCSSMGDWIRVTRLAPGAPQGTREVKYPFKGMEVGETFTVQEPHNRPSLAATAHAWKRRGAGTFTIAVQSDRSLLVTRVE